MTDLTQLNLTDPETIAPEEYVTPYTDNETPVDAGTYSAKLVDGKFKTDGKETLTVRFGAATSRKNGKNYLSAEFAVEVEHALVGKKDVGTRRIYGRVNTIPESLIFNEVKPGRENANAFMDFLVAAGWTKSLRTNDDYQAAVLELVAKNATLRVRTDWQAYSNPKSTEYAGTGETFRGMKNFPFSDQPGIHNPRITDSVGNVLLAKNELKGFYPPKKG